jgi:hypothetical protein
MSVNSIYFNPGAINGGQLRSALSGLEQAVIAITQQRNAMVKMLVIGGDPKDDATYNYIGTRYGTQSDADAHRLFLEIGTAYAQLQTIIATLNQLFEEFR